MAGGKGLRMAAGIPKQFLPLGGKPVLIHSLEAFASFDPEMQLILVLPDSHREYWKELEQMLQPNRRPLVVSGGAERFHSVKNGLSAVSEENTLIAIHDAVRPLVSTETIRRAFDTALQSGAAVPAMPIADSLRRGSSTSNAAISRQEVFAIQTPQVFRREVLLAAYEQPYTPDFTDDASVVEAAGHAITLTAGNPENIKITTPADLKLAERLIHNAT